MVGTALHSVTPTNCEDEVPDTPASQGHDDMASLLHRDVESLSENVPMDILSRHGSHRVGVHRDSVSAGPSNLASPTISTTSLDSNHEHRTISKAPLDRRPVWFKNSANVGKQRFESLSRTLGISPIIKWTMGPASPRPYRIKPLKPGLQSLPATVLSRYASSPIGEAVVTCLLCLFWLITFSAILASAKSTTPASTGSSDPVKLDCTTKLWRKATKCGVDGILCQPFDQISFPFICPADCASKQVLEPHTVGDQEIIYRNFVIGGPRSDDQGEPIYRGDSFICAAAIHAGIVSDAKGGCGVLKRVGRQSDFTSTIRNGITSISFEPSFPLAFSLSELGLSSSLCTDTQWTLLGISATATVLISLLATPPALFFTSIFIISFFQVALASDSTYFPDFNSVVSLAIERFLPAAFVGVVAYHYCIRRILTNMEAYWERTALWLGGCWDGALNNYTFDKIPISRLTPHDLQQQPGAIVALIIILAVISLATVGQIWAFRIEGRLLRYLGFYLTVAVIMGCLIAIPNLNFRLHHYVIGLILLPGTSIQTRPSLLYQGMLVGLFINGVARWGFASILQTTDALRGDGQLGSALPADLIPIITSDTITFTITKLAERFDGLSILINDVERFQQTNVSLPVVFNWTRSAANEVTFFRFAFTGTYTLGGIWYGDYTKTGTWLKNGTWINMLPGPSRSK